jgi:hypothetical protein
LSDYGIHVASVHDGLIVLVNQLSLLIDNLIVMAQESRQLIVERGACHILLCARQLDAYVAIFKYEGHQYVVTYAEVGHLCRIYRAVKMEFAMYHIARVDALEHLVFYYLQVYHAPVKLRGVRRALYLISACTRQQCQYSGKGADE